MAKYHRPVIAILIMAAIIAVMLMLFTPRSTSRSSALDPGAAAPPASPKP